MVDQSKQLSFIYSDAPYVAVQKVLRLTFYLSELYLEWQGVRLCSNMGITAGLATGIIVTI